MSELAFVFSAVFVSNIILTQFLGICSFLGVSKNIKNALGMSYAVTFVLVLASVITWAAYYYILMPLDVAFLKTIVFILTIASLVQLVEMFLKKYSPELYRNMGVYLPLITTNCAILGVALINIQKNYTFTNALINAIANAVGFMLAMLLMSAIRERLEDADMPDCMKNLPIALITASCMSIALMGLAGII